MNNTLMHDLTGRGTRTNPLPPGGRWADLFGLEFELEGVTSSMSPEMGVWWTRHNDGSLVNGMEFVLDRPIGGEQLVSAIDAYYDARIDGQGGLRTSTHIHINGADLTVDQLRSLIAIVYTIEDDLYRFVDEDRKWAGYSCGLAEMSPRRLRAIMSEDESYQLNQQMNAGRGVERYYGLNVASLYRHGSVEFRYFPGMPDRATLENYLDLVEAIKKAAVATPIEELITRIDSEAALNTFLEQLLPENLRQGLLSMSPSRARWEAFNRIAAMAQPEDTVRRQDQLVRVVPQLVYALVKAKHLTPAGGQYLKGMGERLGVMTMRDFSFHLEYARTMMSEDGAKRATRIRRVSEAASRPTPARRGPYFDITRSDWLTDSTLTARLQPTQDNEPEEF